MGAYRPARQRSMYNTPRENQSARPSLPCSRSVDLALSSAVQGAIILAWQGLMFLFTSSIHLRWTGSQFRASKEVCLTGCPHSDDLFWDHPRVFSFVFNIAYLTCLQQRCICIGQRANGSSWIVFSGWLPKAVCAVCETFEGCVARSFIIILSCFNGQAFQWVYRAR